MKRHMYCMYILQWSTHENNFWVHISASIEACYADELIAKRGAVEHMGDGDKMNIQETMYKLKEIAKNWLAHFEYKSEPGK